MAKIGEKILENVDLIRDKDYILEKLKETENDETFSLEEAYDMLMLRIEKFRNFFSKL